MRILILLAVGAVAFYVLIALGMYLGQRRFMYFPTNDNPPPEAVGVPDARVEAVETADGEVLVLWYAEADAGQPTVLFFHGNGGEMAHRSGRFAAYRAAGFGVLFVSYRGYGGSTGRPSEAGLHADAEAAYGWLRDRGVAPEDIVIAGASLGTGVAVQLAARHPVGALVLGAPYSAADDLAADIYPWLPVRLLMRDRFRSVDHIGAVEAPILIQHGTEDRVVPHRSGEALYQAAPEGTDFVSMPGAGHEVLFDPSLWQSEIAFIQRVRGDR
ncbi:alpha/beta hydrolase [Hasllibacter sp. MH4015]|uniref:alpha/beta hydrolase n=1 Tax=Hasllibacter sp. MH4015 TaxID=2854029 RepID=UPI001CD493B9|nr:alpha/beta hydrolase [Hasllibacter sp. MH4015]